MQKAIIVCILCGVLYDCAAAETNFVSTQGESISDNVASNPSYVSSSSESEENENTRSAQVLSTRSADRNDLPTHSSVPNIEFIPIDNELLEVASSQPGLEGWTMIPLGVFRRGFRYALIVWPALDPGGQLIDARVMGIAFDRNQGDGSFQANARRWFINERTQSEQTLAQELGGDDFQVLEREEGVALHELGPELAATVTDFASAVAAGKRKEAMARAMAFLRLVPISRAAFEPIVAQLLSLASTNSASFRHLRTQRQGARATLLMRVMRGSVTLRTLEMTAVSLDDNEDRWGIIEYF